MGQGKGKGKETTTTGTTTTGTTTTTTGTTTTTTTTPRRCTIEERSAFGNTPFGTARCGSGQTYTLVDATVNPMENVVAEVFNFGDCNAVITFNRVNASPITITVQSTEDFTVLIPGRVTSVTAACPVGTGTCDAGVSLTFTQCV